MHATEKIVVRPNDKRDVSSTDWDVVVVRIDTHEGVYARDNAGWFWAPARFTSFVQSIRTGIFHDAVICGLRSIPDSSLPEELREVRA